jgi:hypothetical protein
MSLAIRSLAREEGEGRVRVRSRMPPHPNRLPHEEVVERGGFCDNVYDDHLRIASLNFSLVSWSLSS